MAATTLLFGNGRARIGSLTVDCTLSETHQGDADVTEHPVEKGFSPTDNIRPKPEVVTLDGLITNDPMPDPSAPLVSHVSGSATFSGRSQRDPLRVDQGYAELRRLKDAGALLTIVTSLRTYENMAMTSLNVPRDAKTGEALRFTASFKQVRVVSAQVVQLPVKERKLKPKVPLGTKGNEQTPEPVKKKSLLVSGGEVAHEAVEFVGKLFGGK